MGASNWAFMYIEGESIAEQYTRGSQNLSRCRTRDQILANEIGVGNLFKGNLVKTVTIKCSSYKIDMKYEKRQKTSNKPNVTNG